MIYILLAWLFPLIAVIVLIYSVEEEITVGDFLQIIGIGLIPIFNWVLLYIAVTETVKKSEKIQEFLNRKLK
jgi:positive regulator of sigma E activity